MTFFKDQTKNITNLTF